jgi:hypothetical protein
MDDFTVRIKNLPKDHMYGGDPNHLKAYLMSHFEKVIKNELLMYGSKKEEDFD